VIRPTAVAMSSATQMLGCDSSLSQTATSDTDRSKATSLSRAAAADSRITGDFGVLLDEGGKLFTLPVICRKPGDDGFFSVPYSRPSRAQLPRLPDDPRLVERRGEVGQ
jgi:hypothetical protein